MWATISDTSARDIFRSIQNLISQAFSQATSIDLPGPENPKFSQIPDTSLVNIYILLGTYLISSLCLYSVQDSASSMYTMTTLSQVFADILGSIEHETFSNIHFEFYNQLNIRGTFTLENSMESDVYVTLVIGKKHALKKYD